MSLGSRLTLVVTCLTLIPGPCRAQNDCFTSSSIVGAVLGTFFSTAVALALLVFLLWWIYYRRTPNGTFEFFLPNNLQDNRLSLVFINLIFFVYGHGLYSFFFFLSTLLFLRAFLCVSEGMYDVRHAIFYFEKKKVKKRKKNLNHNDWMSGVGHRLKQN